MRRCALYVDAPDPEVFNLPMELGLQLVTVVSPDFSNADRKVLDDVVNAIDGVGLHVFIKDL